MRRLAKWRRREYQVVSRLLKKGKRWLPIIPEDVFPLAIDKQRHLLRRPMRKLYLRRGYRPLWRQLRGVYDSRRGFKKRMRRRRVYKKLSHYLARRCSSLIPFIPYTFRRKPRKLTKRRRKLAQRRRMRTLRALSRGKRRVGYASRFIFHKQFSTRAYCFDFNRKLNRVLVKRRRAGKKRNRILRVYRPQLRRLSSSIFRLVLTYQLSRLLATV